MPKYRLKSKEVEAVQHLGPQALNVVGKKGEQKANPGDFILIPESGNPTEREVLSAKDFFEQYEAVKDSESSDSSATSKSSGDGSDPGDWTQAGDGLSYPGQPGSPTSVYGVPAFDSIEAAQSAAAEHYSPSDVSGEARPASITPFQCTIGSDGKVYAIQPSGVVSQVAVAHADSTADPGFGTGSGYQDSRFPQSLAIQNGAVRDNPGPVSQFQNGTASAEQPLNTFGNQFQPDMPDHRGETPHVDQAEADRQKAEGVTQPQPETEEGTPLADRENLDETGAGDPADASHEQ